MNFESESDDPIAAPEPMSAEEMTGLFARKARSRLLDLLKLRVEHIYDKSPARENSISATKHGEVRLQLQKTSQPYHEMQRFAQEDKVMGFVINPGLLPIVKALTLASQGRKLLVTRKVGAVASQLGTVAHIDGFGIRIILTLNAETNESTVTWEWLFGVA